MPPCLQLQSPQTPTFQSPRHIKSSSPFTLPPSFHFGILTMGLVEALNGTGSPGPSGSRPPSRVDGCRGISEDKMPQRASPESGGCLRLQGLTAHPQVFRPMAAPTLESRYTALVVATSAPPTRPEPCVPDCKALPPRAGGALSPLWYKPVSWVSDTGAGG